MSYDLMRASLSCNSLAAVTDNYSPALGRALGCGNGLVGSPGPKQCMKDVALNGISNLKITKG